MPASFTLPQTSSPFSSYSLKTMNRIRKVANPAVANLSWPTDLPKAVNPFL